LIGRRPKRHVYLRYRFLLSELRSDPQHLPVGSRLLEEKVIFTGRKTIVRCHTGDVWHFPSYADEATCHQISRADRGSAEPHLMRQRFSERPGPRCPARAQPPSLGRHVANDVDSGLPCFGFHNSPPSLKRKFKRYGALSDSESPYLSGSPFASTMPTNHI
jgi:hypothetical protein